MKIEKAFVQTIIDEQGEEIKVGDTVIYETKDYEAFAKFLGLNNRGAFLFKFPVSEKTVAIMPKSIKKLYKGEGK